MFQQRHKTTSYAVIAVASVAAYLWIANDELPPQVARAAEVQTAAMGGPPSVTAVAEPGMWEQFEQAKKDARVEDLPPQF